MGKRVLGRESHRVQECLTRSLEVMLSPLKVAEIPVGILYERVQANGFLVLGSSLRALAQAGEHNPPEIVDSGVLCVLAFCDS